MWECFGFSSDFAHNQNDVDDDEKETCNVTEKRFIFINKVLWRGLTFDGSVGWACFAAYVEVAAERR